MDSRNNSLSSSISIRRIKENLFSTTIPAFGVANAWTALKITFKKISDIDEITNLKAISAVPDGKGNYLCVFHFKANQDINFLKNKIKWSIYKVG